MVDIMSMTCDPMVVKMCTKGKIILDPQTREEFLSKSEETTFGFVLFLV